MAAHPSAAAPPAPAVQSEYPVIVISDCESEVVVEYSQKIDPSPVFGVQVIVPDSESESEQDVKPSQDLLASVNNLERRIQKQEQDAVLPDIPDIPDVKPQYMDKPESKKLSFSMEEYKDMVPTVVAEIPYDIDGTRWYMIDVPEEDAFFAKYRDGRFFQLHTSRRKGFNGVRRLGKCRGNFVCENTSCPYFTENGSKININLQQLDPRNSAIPVNPLHSEHLALQQNWWNSITMRDCSMSTIKETTHAN